MSFIRRLRFSDVELQHLTIGTLLFTGVMVSLFLFPLGDDFLATLIFAVLLALLTAPLFFLHEIGHKLNAQNFNMWAEFRLDQTGVMLTAISMIPYFPLKFVGPGAVQVRGYPSLDRMGKVAAIGPSVNILLGGIYVTAVGVLLVLSLFVEALSFLAGLVLIASSFSFFLGLFNMIPFGPLDGRKVYMWNQRVFYPLILMALLFWVETGLSFFFTGSVGFLLGGILVNDVGLPSEFLLIYPIILGVALAGVGWYLVVNLQKPHWDPGSVAPFEPETQAYGEDYYSGNSPRTRVDTRPREVTPLGKKCAECGQSVLMPFKCSVCGRYYCGEHRLPGRHFCYVEDR